MESAFTCAYFVYFVRGRWSVQDDPDLLPLNFICNNCLRTTDCLVPLAEIRNSARLFTVCFNIENWQVWLSAPAPTPTSATTSQLLSRRRPVGASGCRQNAGAGRPVWRQAGSRGAPVRPGTVGDGRGRVTLSRAPGSEFSNLVLGPEVYLAGAGGSVSAAPRPGVARLLP